MTFHNFFEKRIYLFVLFIPFIEFINKNLNDITVEIFFYFIIYSIIIFLVIFFFFFFIGYFNKGNNNDNLKFLLSISFYIFFKFQFFKNILNHYNINYEGEISLFLILFIITFLFILNSYTIINKFLKIFLFCYLLIISFQLVYGFFVKNFKQSNNLFQVQSYFSQDEIAQIKGKRNIYYVIVDGMTSLSNFEEQFNEKNISFKKFIKNNNLDYYDTKSAYISTLLSFTSFLNLEYTYTVSDVDFDRSQMFPETMKPHLVNNHQLFKILKSLSIDFFWEGVPIRGTCVQYNLDFCLNYHEKDQIKIFLDRFKINRYILFAFLKNTPVDSIMYRFNFFKKKKIIYPEYKQNNTIDKFLTKMKNFKFDDKSYFFLIHHLSPHEPYIYKKDCSYQDPKKNFGLYPEGYRDAYQCVLKKIKKLVEFINKKDPNAILAIQGDHGVGFGENDYEVQEDMSKTFTLLKISNTQCRNLELSNKLDMVNTVRLLLSCATNQKPNLLVKKSYYK